MLPEVLEVEKTLQRHEIFRGGQTTYPTLMATATLRWPCLSTNLAYQDLSSYRPVASLGRLANIFA